MRVVNRRFLLRKRVLIPIGTALVLALIAHLILLPWVVRWRVDVVLNQFQLHNVTYRLTRATLWTSTLRDVDAGDGNRIDEVRVSYSVEGLWNRRVDNIRVSGLQLTADLHEGGVTIKPLEAMFRQAPPASGPAIEPIAEDVAAGSQNWPFRSVRVEDSTLVVRTRARTMTLPFHAMLRWPRLRADVAGLIIEGAVGDLTAMDVRFRGKGVDGDDLTAVVRAMAPEAPLTIGGAVSLNGTLTRRGAGMRLAADVVAAPDPADESAETAMKIAGTNVTMEEGVFHLEATRGEANRSLKVTAEDVVLVETSMGAKAMGVSGRVAFGDPGSATASTQPTQVVRFDKVSASKFELTDGILRFTAGPGATLHLEEARANLLGGVVSAEDVPVAPGEPVPLTLVVSNVELSELLKLLVPGKATGEGKVNGRLPVIIGADGVVTLGEGAAEASAGGWLSVIDAAALESIAGEAVADVKGDPAAASPQAQVRQNIVEALRDFQYESLVAQLEHDPRKGIVAHVRMKGKGRTGARQALDYDLRVAGLEELIRSAFGLHRTLTREAH